MTLRRRAAALTVVIAMLGAGSLFSTALAAADGTFGDDDGNVHEAAIERIAALGITRGCNPPSNDRYCPREAVTRGEMAAFMVRAFGLDENGRSSFHDTGGHVFEGDIARLADAGITRGCNPPSNDRFCPDDPVTRGQMAAFLVRALGLVEPSDNTFSDTRGNVFETDIMLLAAAGITRGCDPPANLRFCPGDLVLRDQMASFLSRAHDVQVSGSTGTAPSPSTTEPSPQTTSTTSNSSPTTSPPSQTIPPPPPGWTALEPMPEALTDSASAALDGLMYVAGGKRSARDRVRSFMAYQRGADVWSSLAAIPGAGREDASLVALGDHLYIFGGASESPFVGDVTTAARYSATAGWEDAQVANLPSGRSGMAAAVYGGNIWLIGGFGADGNSLSSVTVYDVGTNRYLPGPSLPQPRDHAAAAVIGGRVNLFGGRNRQGGTSVETTTVLRLAAAGTHWEPHGSPMPRARRSFVVGQADGKVQLFGGESESQSAISIVDEFDPASGMWSPPLAPLPTPRHGPAGGTIGPSTFVVGGSLRSGSDSLTPVNERFTR